MGGILGNDTDMVQSGIDTVGQCKVDDTAVTAEIKCGFGTFIRQLVKAPRPPARMRTSVSLARVYLLETWERLLFIANSILCYHD